MVLENAETKCSCWAYFIIILYSNRTAIQPTPPPKSPFLVPFATHISTADQTDVFAFARMLHSVAPNRLSVAVSPLPPGQCTFIPHSWLDHISRRAHTYTKWETNTNTTISWTAMIISSIEAEWWMGKGCENHEFYETCFDINNYVPLRYQFPFAPAPALSLSFSPTHASSFSKYRRKRILITSSQWFARMSIYNGFRWCCCWWELEAVWLWSYCRYESSSDKNIHTWKCSFASHSLCPQSPSLISILCSFYLQKSLRLS